MSDQSADVTINFKTSFSGEGAKQAQNAVQGVSKSAKDSQANLKGTKEQMGGLANQAAGINLSFGMIAKTLGALAIPAFVINSVNTYANTVKSSTQLGNAWAVQADKLNAAYYSLGKTIAGVVLPGMEKAAELAGKAAEWAEDNVPNAISAGEQLSTMLFLKIGEGLDNIAKLDPKNADKDPQAVQKAFLKSLAGITGQAMSPEQKEDARKKQEDASKQLSISKVLEYRQLQRELFEQDRSYNRNLFVMRRNFQKQEEYAEFDYQKSRFRSLRDFNRQISYANEDFYKTQYRSIRDFQRSEAITIEQYNRQRAIASRDFQISLARNEYDYQKQRSRAQYDHNWSIRMAMLEGDAMAIWQSNRQFKIQKERAEEDYQLSKQRSIEDFQRQQNDEAVNFQIERRNAQIQFQIQMADAQMDFNIQRKRTLEQFDIQRKDQEEDFNIERERRRYQYNIQLQDLAYQYNEELRVRRQNFVEKHLPEIILEEGTLAKVRSQITEAEIAKWEGVLASIRGGAIGTYTGQDWSEIHNSMQGYDTGGPVRKTGLALVHEGEYVLNKNTTSAAEMLAKSNRLTNDSFLSMLGSPSMVNNFYRGISAEDKYLISRQMEQLIENGFRR